MLSLVADSVFESTAMGGKHGCAGPCVGSVVRQRPRLSARLWGALAFACVTGAGCGSAYDLDGAAVDPLATRAVTVLAFVSSGCPISNQYAPLLSELARVYAQRGVRFWLVYPSRLDSAAKVRAHLAEFAFGMPALRDPEHRLVKRAGARVTPSVAVFRSDGTVAYAGRIDDRYVSLGVHRSGATKRDLEAALRALLTREAVRSSRTDAVGCAIAE